MGEVDEKPFLKVCEQRFNGENVGLQHAMLCSEWQKNINDSAWHPFKLVVSGEKMKVSLYLVYLYPYSQFYKW